MPVGGVNILSTLNSVPNLPLLSWAAMQAFSMHRFCKCNSRKTTLSVNAGKERSEIGQKSPVRSDCPYLALQAAQTHIAVHKYSQFLVTQRLQFLTVVKIFRGELVFNNVVQQQVLHIAVNSGAFICSQENKDRTGDSLRVTTVTLKTSTCRLLPTQEFLILKLHVTIYS